MQNIAYRNLCLALIFWPLVVLDALILFVALVDWLLFVFFLHFFYLHLAVQEHLLFLLSDSHRSEWMQSFVLHSILYLQIR